MIIKQLAVGAVLALVLGACALQPEQKLPPQPEAMGVELIKEQNGRFIAFVGPRQQHGELFLGVSDTNYFCLRSWLDNKTGEIAHQLYVEDSFYGGPYKWNGAHDQSNQQLRYIEISHNEITCDLGCSYADEFAAGLPEDYLRAHKSGLSVTFTSAEGKTLAIAVPGNLVATELAAVDAVRAIAAKAAANPPAPAAATAAPSAPAPPAPAPAPSPAAKTPPASGGR